MTTAIDVLHELRRQGLEVWAAGDRLRYRPRDVLDRDPALRARVLEAKPELLRLLSVRERCGTLDQGLAVREVLGFPAGLLGELPLPTTLVLELQDAAEPITIGAHPGCPRATLGPSEWLAIVLAAESGRASPAHFAAWLARKRAYPSWQLTPAEALGPEQGARPPIWTVGQVLERLGATLRLVQLQGGVG